MKQKYIVRGQSVTAEKVARAKELRSNMTEAENSCGKTCVQTGWMAGTFDGSRSLLDILLISIVTASL
jgi:hypothetical protein